MSHREHIRLLRAGDVESWNEMVRAGSLPSLAGEDLSGINLEGVNFQKANLKAAILRSADLANANLQGANLESADLSRAKLTNADLSGASLKQAELSGSVLRGAIATQADFCNANLAGVDLRTAVLDDAQLRNAKLPKARFAASRTEEDYITGEDFTRNPTSSASLMRADLTGANLADADLRLANLSQAILEGATLNKADLAGAFLLDTRCHSAHFVDACLEAAQLTSSDLTHAQLARANLARAHLAHCVLEDADLTAANLSHADLRNASVNSETQLRRSQTNGCRVLRFTLDCLRDGRGGLTDGDLSRMQVDYGLASLRSSYSGFWQWIHLAALLTFLLPYAWFLLTIWPDSKPSTPEGAPTATILEALIRYVATGGSDLTASWTIRWVPFSLFTFSIGYNALRFILLAKTKRLELEEEVRGHRVPFSLDEAAVPLIFTWGTLKKMADWGFRTNLAVVSLHTLYFLLRRIPEASL